MPFCSYCGQQLLENAPFCHSCGSPTRCNPMRNSTMRCDSEQNTPPQNKQTQDRPIQNNPHPFDPRAMEATRSSYMGRGLQCPKCGGIIDALSVVCPYCGMVFEGRETNTSTVKELILKLDEIDGENREFKTGFWSMVQKEAYGTDERAEFQKEKLKRKIALIRSYPIPNTIEQITEFMILADTNINTKISKNTLFHKIGKDKDLSGSPELWLSDTWVIKMQAVYKKAEMVFRTVPTFRNIQMMYAEKAKKLNLK